MRFPEWLWQLLPGDSGTQQLGVIWRQGVSSQTAATVGLTIYTVPPDKCLILTNAALRFTSGAAQIVARRRLMADPPDGTTRYDILDDEVNSTVASAVTNVWTGEVVIPGGWKVRVEGDYDAGVNANSASAEIHGYLIPRGTFIFG